jgi:hypothetical protein
MIETSGSVPWTNGSGSGRPKILQIQIRKTVSTLGVVPEVIACVYLYHFTVNKLCKHFVEMFDLRINHIYLRFADWHTKEICGFAIAK